MVSLDRGARVIVLLVAVPRRALVGARLGRSGREQRSGTGVGVEEALNTRGDLGNEIAANGDESVPRAAERETATSRLPIVVGFDAIAGEELDPHLRERAVFVERGWKRIITFGRGLGAGEPRNSCADDLALGCALLVGVDVVRLGSVIQFVGEVSRDVDADGAVAECLRDDGIPGRGFARHEVMTVARAAVEAHARPQLGHRRAGRALEQFGGVAAAECDREAIIAHAVAVEGIGAHVDLARDADLQRIHLAHERLDLFHGRDEIGVGERGDLAGESRDQRRRIRDPPTHTARDLRGIRRRCHTLILE